MTAVRTPHAAQIWNKHERKGFTSAKSQKAGGTQKGGRRLTTDDLTTDDVAAGFIPQRDTGQGNVMSSACRAAVFDILLTALELDKEVTGTTRLGQMQTLDTRDGTLHMRTIYYPRLERRGGYRESQMSCQLSALQISTIRLRLFILGMQGIKYDDARGATIFHTFEWERSIYTCRQMSRYCILSQRDDNGLSQTNLAYTKARKNTKL